MKWARRVGWVLAGVLALWGVLWLAVPPLLKSQVERRASDALGRAVTIGAVAFRPWGLQLTLRDVVIAGRAAGDPPLLSVARVHADADIRSALRAAPVLEALEVEAPRLHVARLPDGGYDFADVVDRLKPAADAPPGKPARFALYNLRLDAGEVVLDDRAVKRTHRLDGLAIGLPFISNLPAHIDIKVAPRLAFRLNGAAFDSGGEAKPFAAQRMAALQLRVPDLDLVPYLPYLPAGLPLKLERGRVSLDVSVQFDDSPDAAPSVRLTGRAALRDTALALRDGRPLAAWRALEVPLADVQPLTRRVRLGAVRLEAPQFELARDAGGRLSLPQQGAAQGPGAPSMPAWDVAAESFELADGSVIWRDASTTPRAELRLAGLGVALQRPAWPMAAPLPVKLSASLQPGAPSVAVEGEASDRTARLDVRVADLDAALLAPYLVQVLKPRLEGSFGVRARVEWGADPAALKLTLDEGRASALRVVDGRSEVAALRELSLAGAQVDVLARRASLGRVTVAQPVLRLERARDGSLNVERWMAQPARKGNGAAPPGKGSGAGASDKDNGAAPPWRAVVDELTVEAGRLQFVDASWAEPVRVDVDALELAVQGLDSAPAAGAAPAKVQLSARLAAGAAPGRPRERGVPAAKVEWRGQAALAPLSARGSLRVERFPLALFEPYFNKALKADLLRADAGFRGDISVRQESKGLRTTLVGDALLADVRVQTRPDPGGLATPDELLNWQAFTMKGVRIDARPGAKPRIEVAEAQLSDFFSRLIITEQGSFNLLDVAPAPDGAASAPRSESAAPLAAASAPPSPSALPAEPDTGLRRVDLTLGATSLVNGRIDFTDRFVRPSFSAQLTELNGRLGRFSSTSRDMATLELRGRAAGTALLDIRGALNPTADPLALDIQAKVTDLELAPLSPYAGKYAGYAIERGKLSVDLAYRIDPDGKLDAKNQVILNQLTFGDKVESPQATKLPVRLAVALLKDRNGVIDINLPVSGSINDPQFSVFGIVLRVIGNLLVKVVTAPFALLAGGGGADDLSTVEFAPGSAVPAEAARGVIDKVATALTERPALKMTVTGAADPASEREAVQRTALEARLLAERRRELLRAGAAADAPVTLTADDRARLLREVYRSADLPGKPRNVVGMQKDLPPDQMEALLRSATVVNDESARELALQRGLAVRDALIAKGLTSERLFLAAPKLHTSGDGDAAWTPQVKLVLSVN